METEKRVKKNTRLEKIRVRRVTEAHRLKGLGHSTLAIAVRMRVKESTVRSWLKSGV